jgi:hypothetical protein
MDEMPGAGHQCGQSLGMGFRPFGPVRGFDQMDVVMDRAGMYPFTSP